MPSSVIRKYYYFPENEIRRIIYQSGAVYDYMEVPQNIFDQFRSFTSKGWFLNKNIKPRFKFIKIE